MTEPGARARRSRPLRLSRAFVASAVLHAILLGATVLLVHDVRTGDDHALDVRLAYVEPDTVASVEASLPEAFDEPVAPPALDVPASQDLPEPEVDLPQPDDAAPEPLPSLAVLAPSPDAFRRPRRTPPPPPPPPTPVPVRAAHEPEPPAPAKPPVVRRPPVTTATATVGVVTAPDLASYYPYQARLHRWEGTAEVWFRIDAKGHVVEARVVRSSGYAVLDAAALDVVHAHRFTRGAPDRTSSLPVRFRLVS